MLFSKELEKLRIEINAKPAAMLREAVSAFESAGRDDVKAMLEFVALSDKRVKRAEALRFHDLKRMSAELKEIFDIDLLKGLKSEAIELANLMFLRATCTSMLVASPTPITLSDLAIRASKKVRPSAKSPTTFAPSSTASIA